MMLQREAGGYVLGVPVRLAGSFKYTASGNVVDTVRDGNSKCIASVTRVSAGLYEITFDTGFPIPEIPIFIRAGKSAGSATPAKCGTVEYVEGTYSQSTRKFRIVHFVAGDTANAAYVDPVVTDPDDGVRFHFELLGSIVSVGTDPA